jgi:hypothetical protein
MRCLCSRSLIQYSYPLCYHTHSLAPLLRAVTLMWRALEPRLKQGYHLFPSYGSTTEESLCLKYLSRTWQRWFHLLVHGLMVAYPELEFRRSLQKMGSSSYQHLKYRCVIFWNTFVKYMSYIFFIAITGSMVYELTPITIVDVHSATLFTLFNLNSHKSYSAFFI